MKDKNGIELRTGQIVEITGGFFKADNGRFVIVSAPGDQRGAIKNGVTLEVSEYFYSLRRVSQKNEFSLAKHYTYGSWPLVCVVSGYAKQKEVDAYNDTHAQIEVVGEMADVKIKDEIADYERQKKHWRGNTAFLNWIQERIDELSAQLNA